MITSARCSRSTQWPETRIGSTCGALSVILLPFGFLCCCRVLSMWILQLSHCLLIWGRCQGWLTLSSSCTRCYSVSCCLTLVHAHLHSFIRTCSFSLVRVCFHWYACVFTGTRSCVCSHLYRFVLAHLRSFSFVCIHFQLHRFVFMCTHSFSCVRVCFHSYVFVLTCTGSFTVVHVCLSYSQWYALVLIVLSCTHPFSVICTCFQLDTHFFALVFSWMPSFSVYAFILSDTHSFSVGRTRSWLDTLVLGWTHSFLVVHTCSRLYALVLTCMHSSSPAYPYPLDDTEPQFTAVTTDSSKEVDVEGRGKRRRVANTQYKDFWQH